MDVATKGKIKILVVGDVNTTHLWRWCCFLQKAGFTVSVLSHDAKYIKALDYTIFEHYYNYSLGRTTTGLLKNVKKLAMFLRSIFLINRNDFDFVNYHFIRKGKIISSLLINKKSVFTCYGSDILLYFNNIQGYKKILYDRALRKTHLITYDADSVRDTILSRTSRIDPRKMRLVHWGVDTELFSPAADDGKKALRETFHLPTDAVVLLSIRSLKPNYRIKDIIEWFKKTVTSKGMLLYVRVPPYSDQDYVELCKRAAGSSKQIVFNEDDISYFSMHQLYQMADINLHFPRSDALSVSLLEAMASGNLILASSSVEAYHDLAKTYRISLIALPELSQQNIFKMLEDKEEIACSNRSKLKDTHSEAMTIANLHECFENLYKG